MKNVKSVQIGSDEVILHGECMVFKSAIPAGARKIKKTDKALSNGYLIVADSEFSGNHHVVDCLPNTDEVEFFQDEKGSFFMRNNTETTIRCLHADRHDSITIPPGTYEFGTQQEYDPFAVRMQKVRD